MIRGLQKRVAAGHACNPFLNLLVAGVFALALIACNTRDRAQPSLLEAPWSFDADAEELREASCPAGTVFKAATRVQLNASPVSLTDIDKERDLPGATFVGGWHLRSPASDFGGLSGLALDSDDNLLAISDRGTFVWIELARGAPAAAGMARMRGADGAILSGLRQRDAEGLDLRDGTALVSFEHAHRILAFDLSRCGAAAHGMEVSRLGNRIAGMRTAIKPNAGAEGLVLTAEGGLLLAIETPGPGLPMARVGRSGAASVAGWIERRGEPVLTGLDRVGDTFYALLRSYSPGSGNTIEVLAFAVPPAPGLIEVKRILRLEPRHGTDNFEGIALQRLESGGLRLWMVSDDNFSSRQRTLLYVFDLAVSAE
ncbi:MAG: esterase-like activity of phytase family protein [Chromatocurvus sp.]